MNRLKKILGRCDLLLIVLCAQFFLPASAQSQQAESLTTFAKGHGSVVSAVEERKVSAALVVLRQNGQAMITLYSDLQIQTEATWSVSDSAPNQVLLKITGGELSGTANGSGKLILSDDGKSIKELTIKGKSSNGPEITITFVADASESLRSEYINLVSY